MFYHSEISADNLNYYHLAWGNEAAEKNRLTKWNWVSHYFWSFFRLMWCIAYLEVMLIRLPLIPFNVYEVHFDACPLQDETKLNQDSTVQSYNFLPFIACIHLYSTSKFGFLYWLNIIGFNFPVLLHSLKFAQSESFF